MSWRRWLISSLLALTCAQTATADPGDDLERELTLDEKLAHDDESEVLEELARSPLDVNTADAAMLQELLGLDQELARAVVFYREANGPFASSRALLLVPGMTPEILYDISPFITAAPTARAEAWQTRLSLGAVGRAESRARSYLEADLEDGAARLGVLASYREAMSATWDLRRGQLMSSGPRMQPELESAYASLAGERWRVLAGSYQASFGQKLTFASRPWVPSSRLSVVDSFSVDMRAGEPRVLRSLFGVAVRAHDLAIGESKLAATVFGSRVAREVYQYDLRYGYDDGAPAACTLDADCKRGYRCDAAMGVCYSSKVYDEDGRGDEYSHATLRDAYLEQLGGANVELSIGDALVVDATAYLGSVAIAMAAPAGPWFAPSSRYAAGTAFGALGTSGRLTRDKTRLSWEYAHAKDNAAYARLSQALARGTELGVALRYYGPAHVNPYGRGEAAPDIFLGQRACNELGGRLDFGRRFVMGLRLTSFVDAWRSVRALDLARGSPWHLRLEQRVAYAFGSSDTAALTLRYANKDLGQNGRTESYLLASSDAAARGERRALQGDLTSRPLGAWRLMASGAVTAMDVAFLLRSFAHPWWLRLAARGGVWPGGEVACAFTHRREVGGAGGGDEATRYLPIHALRLGVAQSFGEDVTLRASYAAEARENDGDAWALRHVFAASLDGRL